MYILSFSIPNQKDRSQNSPKNIVKKRDISHSSLINKCKCSKIQSHQACWCIGKSMDLSSEFYSTTSLRRGSPTRILDFTQIQYIYSILLVYLVYLQYLYIYMLIHLQHKKYQVYINTLSKYIYIILIYFQQIKYIS